MIKKYDKINQIKENEMKKKIISCVTLSVLTTGCVPNVEVSKYGKIDRFEKNIKITASEDLKKPLQTKFLSQGWNVATSSKDEGSKRYELKCESSKQKDKYNASCILIDNKTAYKIAEVKTILYTNTLEKTVDVIYEKMNEQNTKEKKN